MDEPAGRRAANKRATRAAIQTAARELFAAHGYEATSIREIAARAGVGERTFYRYFDGKEGLVAGELERWLELLSTAIHAQPPGRDALEVARDALIDLADQISRGSTKAPRWFLTDQPNPYELLQKSAPRPLVRFEGAITDALLARSGPNAGPSARYEASLIARVSMAVVRSVAVRRRELQREQAGPIPPAAELLAEAFTRLTGSRPGSAGDE